MLKLKILYFFLEDSSGYHQVDGGNFQDHPRKSQSTFGERCLENRFKKTFLKNHFPLANAELVGRLCCH